jgi:hypothetical protein
MGRAVAGMTTKQLEALEAKSSVPHHELRQRPPAGHRPDRRVSLHLQPGTGQELIHYGR